MKKFVKKNKWIYLLLVAFVLAGYIFYGGKEPESTAPTVPTESDVVSDVAYIPLNDNLPEFTEDDLTTTAYEFYSALDALDRCGYTMACIGRELMPTEERGSIGQVKPTGWHTVKYDFVDGKYLYNRCHLIGFQLTGENANDRNLITGTRYMNVDGMLPFENMVADYIKETGNHVIYRVTPIFEGENLVASGVQMEAYSVEDDGDGICFNVYVYNKQPGVTIDYYTGVSYETDTYNAANAKDYVLNMKEKVFHVETCSARYDIENPREFNGDRDALLNCGYKTCKSCKP